MGGKVTLVDYNFMMEEYVCSTTGCSEPSDEEFAAQFIVLDGIVKPEDTMSENLPKAVPKAWLTDHNGHEYLLLATAHKVDPSDPTKQRVDISLFNEDDAPENSTDPTNYAANELSIECKPDEELDDPFDDFEPNYQATSDQRRENFGQIISYAALVFAKQHRTHFYTVVFLGNMARIVRWDRGGAIVTEKFNYVEEPVKLGKFFWHFVRLSDAQRGHDTSVTRVLPTSADYRLMQDRADNPRLEGDDKGKHAIGEHARLLFKESLKSNVPWYRVRVGGEQDGSHFLVGAPHFISPGLVGRGTRGYIAIDCSDPEGPFVYLKDVWRVAHDSIEQEGSILAYLNDEKTGKVVHIPTLMCHGDVDDQKTMSLKFHRHYRLVVKEVALPMSEFKNTEELVFLVTTCIIAHGEAYKKGVMHRDISAGNVLILVRERVVDGKLVEERYGFLTDWELSKRIDALEQPEQLDRTAGTWQFMSAYTLNFPTVVIRKSDEMESFFNVVLFFALRFLLNNCPDVSSFMHKYFDGFDKVEGEYMCGETKWNAIFNGHIAVKGSQGLQFYVPPDPSADSSEPLKTHPITFLIQDLLKNISARYKLDPETANVGVIPPTTVAPQSSAYFAYFHSRGLDVSEQRPQQPGRTAIEEQALKQKAETLEDHKATMDLFGSFLVQYIWPKKDTVPDQLR